MSTGEMTRRQLPTEKSALLATALVLALTGAAMAQSAPDTENGRYTLAPASDGFLRLDTRTGASSICADKGNGWACLAMPDERAALDSEIGRLSRDNERLKADLEALKRDGEGLRKDNEALKAQLAQRDAPAAGKTDEALPKSDSLRKPEIKSSDGERKLEIPLPSDREMDRLMAFVESAWRKLVDIAAGFKKTSAAPTGFEAAEATERCPGYAPTPTIGPDMTASKTISRTPLSHVEATCLIAAKLAVRTQGTGFVDLTQEVGKVRRRKRGARRRGEPVRPPYLGVADDPGKCRPDRAGRPDKRAAKTRAGIGALASRDRRTGRHAGACEDHADRDLAANPGAGRTSRTRHLAGDLSDRAPAPAAQPRSDLAVHRHRRLTAEADDTPLAMRQARA